MCSGSILVIVFCALSIDMSPWKQKWSLHLHPFIASIHVKASVYKRTLNTWHMNNMNLWAKVKVHWLLCFSIYSHIIWKLCLVICVYTCHWLSSILFQFCRYPGKEPNNVLMHMSDGEEVLHKSISKQRESIYTVLTDNSLQNYLLEHFFLQVNINNAKVKVYCLHPSSNGPLHRL